MSVFFHAAMVIRMAAGKEKAISSNGVGTERKPG